MDVDNPDDRSNVFTSLIPLQDLLSPQQRSYAGSETDSDASNDRQDRVAISDPSRRRLSVRLHRWRGHDRPKQRPRAQMVPNTAVGSANRQEEVTTTSSVDGISFQDAMPGSSSGPREQSSSHAPALGGTHTLASGLGNLGRIQNANDTNLLKGKSFGIFSPNSSIRLWLCDLLVHPFMEPFIFTLIMLQMILLAMILAPENPIHEFQTLRIDPWVGWVILVLFCIYTVELIAKSIVSGFIINPPGSKTIDGQVSTRETFLGKWKDFFETSQTHRRLPTDISLATTAFDSQVPNTLRPFTSGLDDQVQAIGGSKAQRRARLAHRAFLRHSLNRVDFIAVCAFWASFILSAFGVYEIYFSVLYMLAALRILRLLYLVPGTMAILRNLKTAAPTLLHVASLIGFFWVLFAVIGLQSFKSSLHRSCVFLDPSDPTGQNNWANGFQFCGGWLADDGSEMPWLLSDGELNGSNSPKGFMCPEQSKCIQGYNPYNGSVSFDNIFQSLELVFVVMSSRTFSDSLSYLTDSEGLLVTFFFACSIIVLFFWQRSLVIAVIASSFQIIREGGNVSAFTGQQNKSDPSDMHEAPLRNLKTSTLLRIWNRTRWFWIALIAFGLIVQGLRTSAMGEVKSQFIDLVETVVTLALLFEIIARLLINRRTFFQSKTNILDLILAVITTILQIPFIRNSGQPYAWLTIFQILRIYRVILASPITRDLVLVVLGNVHGLFNLILFVLLLTFLAAVLASQMFRGLLPDADSNGNVIAINFHSMWNSFLGMYQVFSADGWTVIMYNLTTYTAYYNTAWIWAIFFIVWFIFANFITMNMFIAIILESFDIDEDEKRLQQAKAFLQEKESSINLSGTLSLSAIFKYAVVSRGQPSSLAPETTTNVLLTDAVVKDFLDQQNELTPPPSPQVEGEMPTWRAAPTIAERLPSWMQGLIDRIMDQEPNPFHSTPYHSLAYQDLEPIQKAEEIRSARQARRQAQRDYLQKYPKCNVSLFVFKPDSMIRRVCQRIIGPASGGERIEGVSPSLPAWYAFSAFIYLAIVAMVILACITTPLYQKDYFRQHVFSVWNWFVYADLGFATLFTFEAAVKIIADGFFFTPNAFLRSGWGQLDAVVLVALWISVVAALYNEGQVSRAVGAFKALRALRLLNISESTGDHFYALIVRSSLRVVSATFVSISLLIPSAIYGLNLFAGKMQSCNNIYTSISDLNDCVGEYMSIPSTWKVLAPSVVSNTYYSFDDFGSSFFTLFQIVSQQGWVEVMWQAIQITGVGRQPAPHSSYGNAFFFIIFNMLGVVFVLSLFISVFMRSYAEQTGVAFLTVEQRNWLELRKQLRNTNPSRRPLPSTRRKTWKEWCYRRAMRKTGKWSKLVNGVLIFHLILLCSESYPSKVWWDGTRDWIFLVLVCFYIADVVIQAIGLGSHYLRSAWNLYALVSISCALVTSILVLAQRNNETFSRLQKYSLDSIVMLLVPRNNQLYGQFKRATAPLHLLLYLMVVWFVFFLVFAIALTEIFGLTKFNVGESSNVNLRNIPKALILLFRTSVGDGWNNIMEDFATMLPPYCTVGNSFTDGDCGNRVWARFLFTAWNILSVYIFISLFVAIIYESFAFAYQRSKGLIDVSREEIRRFKQAWAEFDPDGTGFITAEAFPRLLRELTGLFAMRVYDGDFTVVSLLEDCSESIEGTYGPRQISITRLNGRLAELPTGAIQKRRRRMNAFFEEVLASSDSDKCISFTSVLMILAHYNIINDRKSLSLEEFLRRREQLQRIDEVITRKLVIGLFETACCSRKFRNHLRFKRAAQISVVPRFEGPCVFVDDGDHLEDDERGPR